MRVVKNIDSFKGNSDISTWIYTIAKRKILRYVKNEKKYSTEEIESYLKKGEIPFSEKEAEKSVWVKEQCDSCLTAFCHCLNNESRLIFLFKEIAYFSYADIGTIMETSEENVRKIASRSKKKMKNFMEHNCILFNPSGNCRCRIKRHIVDLYLHREYEKAMNIAELATFFRKFDQELPQKDYWLKFF